MRRRQRDKLQFDQYRPYVTMMHSRALGAAGAGDATTTPRPSPRSTRGSRASAQFLRDYDQAENEAECVELGFLLRWRKEVEGGRPVGPVERLEQQLELAVALEDYEEAARLRDQLQRLKGIVVRSGPRSS